MEIKENVNVHGMCNKKVIQVFHTVHLVIFIGGTGPVVGVALYPLVEYRQNTTVSITRVFCTHVLCYLLT